MLVQGKHKNGIFGMQASWLKQESSYTEEQIEAILNELGIEVLSETDTVFSALCPFHRNTDTPSFAVNKENGTFICFSPACDERGSLLSLVMRVRGVSIFPARRIIDGHAGNSRPLEERVEDILKNKDELPRFPAEVIERMARDFWGSPAHEYMKGRGFDDETLSDFQIGYSKNKGLVAVPVHDWDGNPVGVIGRTIVGKRFENSKKLPTKSTLFNIHRAKRKDRVIIVESSMDAMRLHQLGFPNAVATCGGFFTNHHAALVNKYFSEIIIMTDNEDPEDYKDVKCKKCKNTCLGHRPGRALGEKIIKMLPGKRIRWAAFGDGIIYPHGAKDPGDMTPEENIQCISNAISTAEMEWWKRSNPDLAIV